MTFSNSIFRNDGKFGYDSYGIQYRAGFKYYFLQNKHIKNGKSGNNLSGQYVFIRGQFDQRDVLQARQVDDLGFLVLEEVRQKGTAGQLGYGYQREVLDNFFFDLNIGITKNLKLNLNRDIRGIGFVSNIKVGLMF